MDKILTVADVAAFLQVQPITVREMFRDKRLRAFKIGKAWRTTHEMLQEDIQTLARGEKPPVLAPETSAADTPDPAPASTPKASKPAASRKRKAPTEPLENPPPHEEAPAITPSEEFLF